MTATIKNAIARSISHNERVHITLPAETAMVDLIEASAVSECWDHCDENRDEQGRQRLDVWGGPDEDTMEWRLLVTLA